MYFSFVFHGPQHVTRKTQAQRMVCQTALVPGYRYASDLPMSQFVDTSMRLACRRAESDCEWRERDPRQQARGELGARIDGSARDRGDREHEEARGDRDKAAMWPGCRHYSKTLAGKAILRVAASGRRPSCHQRQGPGNECSVHARG